jgi:hypothetical protein
MKKELKLKFSPGFLLNADNLNIIEYNEPAESKKYIPNWYKRLSKFHKSNSLNKLHPINDRGTDGSAASTKLCMPFFDALTSGYLITLPYDLLITDDNGKPLISFQGPENIQPLKLRDPQGNELLQIPTGYSDMHFVWCMPISIKLPDGYSFLITHPFNRFDLPFITMTGIIDANFALQPNSNLPFFIKQGFEGMVPQGTPIAQILPFKRESWQLNKKNGLVLEGENILRKSKSVFYNWYKKTYWERKEYN